MRFPLITVIAVLFLSCLLAVESLFLFSFGEQESNEYWTLMKEANPKHTDTTSPYQAKQLHQQVCKEVWFVEKEQRLKLRILSACAELVLDHQGDKTEIVEVMQDVNCYMQEELYYLTPEGTEIKKQANGQFILKDQSSEKIIQIADYSKLKPMQVIRYLQAAVAEYHYSTEFFLAKDVKIVRFIAPGHVLVETLSGGDLLMSGMAKSAEFSMAGGNIHFRASHFKASLHPKNKTKEGT